jgi:tRNA threonylcarbamoyladenosine biosynthesis protein TsaB
MSNATNRSFKCIAIETATERCSVAASNNENTAIIELSSPKESSREVYAAIQQALDDVELSLDDLDCIAFGCGPGSFTGLRTAAGVAQGLAYARALPVCRISTLAALAGAAASKEHTHVAACLDARMDEAYLGLYECSQVDGVRAIKPDRLLAPEAVHLDTIAGGWLAAGPGWTAWPSPLASNAGAIAAQATDVWPNAGAVLTLAGREFALGNVVTAAAAVPNYIRDQVTG